MPWDTRSARPGDDTAVKTRAYARSHRIDLGRALRKDEILEVLAAAAPERVTRLEERRRRLTDTPT